MNFSVTAKLTLFPRRKKSDFFVILESDRPEYGDLYTYTSIYTSISMNFLECKSLSMPLTQRLF